MGMVGTTVTTATVGAQAEGQELVRLADPEVGVLEIGELTFCANRRSWSSSRRTSPSRRNVLPLPSASLAQGNGRHRVSRRIIWTL